MVNLITIQTTHQVGIKRINYFQMIINYGKWQNGKYIYNSCRFGGEIKANREIGSTLGF